MLFLVIFSLQSNAEEVPQAVHDLVPTLQKFGHDPILIEAVNAQNAKGLTLASIKERDKEWRQTNGFDAEMEAMMKNSAAKKLSEFENTKNYFFELFLMDNQGANVAMTNKTSDYWQGDEAKWQESFNEGKGAVHIGEVEFDDSAQYYLVQVSVPVIDAGVAIGAITIGVNLDALEGN